jgi:hypothetical protein
MTQQDFGWRSSPPHWPPAPHSTETEHRLTIVEIEVERVTTDHEKFKDSTQSKILWLERGLQAVAYGLLTLAFWMAPGKAQGLAEAILGMLKR